jgi:DNA modification methylase
MKGSAGHGSFVNMSRAILLYQKGGTFRTWSVLRDVLWTPPEEREKKYYDWEQPLSEAVELVRCLSAPGSTVCDLAFGSGTSAVATARCSQGRKFLGCETHEGRVRVAESRVAEVLGLAKVRV